MRHHLGGVIRQAPEFRPECAEPIDRKESIAFSETDFHPRVRAMKASTTPRAGEMASLRVGSAKRTYEVHEVMGKHFGVS